MYKKNYFPHEYSKMFRYKSLIAMVYFYVLGVFITIAIGQDHKEQPLMDTTGPVALRTNVKCLKHTIVTPHMNQRILQDTNVLWCSTFQLAWNELCNLFGGPIRMEKAPTMVQILNQREASKNDLDEHSYIAMAGLGSEGIYKKINEKMQNQFQGQANPQLFEEIHQSKMEWIAYAYLYKQLPFRWAFTRFHGNLEFGDKDVDSFGIDQLLNDQKDETRMASQVTILDYHDSDNFIIELKTCAKDDRLILAKIPPRDTLRETIATVECNIVGKKPRELDELTDLYIPILNFNLLHEYEDLYYKLIHTDKHGDTFIIYAAQLVQFRLDETGAVLESEAIVAMGGKEIKRLIFDKPFLILLKRRGAKRPYFALWVANAELLVSTPDVTRQGVRVQ